jgi:uncharacterized membrane protein AbrB (regulator of aidB expression)
MPAPTTTCAAATSSPGGFAEMSLIGLALGIEIAMVATHHLFRLFLILLTSPLIFRLWLRKAEPEPSG